MSLPEQTSIESQRAPGCFGSPSCYTQDSKICKECPASSACGGEVLKTLERIKGVINVDDLLHQHHQALEKARAKREAEKAARVSDMPVKPARAMPKNLERTSKVEKITYEIDERTMSLIGTLPVKAQPFAIQLCKSGMVDRIKKDVKEGANPLEQTGPKFLALALKVLMESGFSKAGLRGQYIKNFTWTDNTAASHVSLVVKLFTMFEIAIENEDGFVVNPELLSETN